MTHVVQAGVEELIWIVVGIFWVIAQIAGGAAKKKKAPPRPATDEAGAPAEDPFADLLRKLAGVQEIKAPTPPEPKPLPRAVPLPPEGEMHRASEPVSAPKPEPIIEIPEVDIRPTMSSFRNIMPAMKLPSMKMSFQTSERSTEISPMLGNIINPADKHTLRRAMLSHIIFSPPKALEQWNGGIVE